MVAEILISAMFANTGLSAQTDLPRCNEPVPLYEYGVTLRPLQRGGNTKVFAVTAMPDSNLLDKGLRLSDEDLASTNQYTTISFAFNYDPEMHTVTGVRMGLNYGRLVRSDGSRIEPEEMITSLSFDGAAFDGSINYIGYQEAEFAGSAYPAGFAEKVLGEGRPLKVRTCEKVKPLSCSELNVAFKPNPGIIKRAAALAKSRHEARQDGTCKPEFS